MLETLADHDDELMEQLLEDIQPPRDKVFDDLAKELRDGLVCPVLIGIGDPHQRRAAAAEGAAARSARRRRDRAAARRQSQRRCGRAACSKPSTPAMAASCRSRGCWPARPATAPTFLSGDDEAGRVAGVFKLVGQHTEKRGPAMAGETVAFGKLDKAKTGDTLSAGKQPHAPLAKVEAVSAGARDRDHGEGAQGRRQARPSAQQARRRRPFPHHRAQSGDARGGAVGAGRNAPARRHRAARRPLWRRHRAAPAVGRLPRDHPQAASSSAAATRSNPAATASSATSCWRSSRCRAARVSRSRTRSPAAWCRATTSRRSRRA